MTLNIVEFLQIRKVDWLSVDVDAVAEDILEQIDEHMAEVFSPLNHKVFRLRLRQQRPCNEVARKCRISQLRVRQIESEIFQDIQAHLNLRLKIELR